MTGGADFLQVHGQQQIALFDLLSNLDRIGEAVSAHLHGVHADVNEELHTGGLQTDRM